MSSAPSMFFEFADDHGNIRPMLFQTPVNILEAHSVEEVKAVFDALEKATDEGYYVAGYVSYEAAPAFDFAYKVNEQRNVMPLVWFGVFEEPVRDEPSSSREQRFDVTDWHVEEPYNAYQINMKAIRDAIEKGDTYQINYTTRMRASFEGDPYTFYKQLSRNQTSSYCAYLDIGDYEILSASPELFFRKDKNLITTKPMKGTSPRGRWVEEDQRLAEDLHQSEKNRAENLMIVDLLRNDLGRMAEAGTIRVPRLFEIESYPTVHQMTSTIQGEVDLEKSIFDWFRALFPCGSITGAPKIKTMDYIAQLEKSPREVYCGAIGYITPEKDAVFNVPIRTVWVDHNTKQAEYGTGGGVTWDSTSQGEYEELKTKAKLLTESRPSFQLLETMKLEEGEIELVNRHLTRLKKSALYFGFEVDVESISQNLGELKKSYKDGMHKIRLLASSDGSFETEISEISRIDENMKAALASEPVNSADPFLYHKTTHREVYNKHKVSRLPEPTSVLLWNEREELTEFIIGNVVLEIGGELLTPPIQSGLLAGTFRGGLLDKGIIKERELFKQDLQHCSRMWMINGLRGWVEVTLI